MNGTKSAKEYRKGEQLEITEEKMTEETLEKIEEIFQEFLEGRNENSKKINKADLLKDFLRKIAQLAIEKGRADIVDFLSKNEDDLIEILIKE